MRRCFVFLLLSLSVLAQQPNSADATLRINGASGPPWPIVVPIYTGTTGTLHFSGTAGAPVILGQSPNLSPGFMQTPAGTLDLDYPTIQPLIIGSEILDASGQLSLSVPIPVDLPISTMSFQGAVASASAPTGFKLTAATQANFTLGVITQNVSLGGNNSTAINLSSFGLQVAFYGNLSSTLFLNANGSLTFNSGNATFQQSGPLFLAQQPHIAMFWTDLDPSAGGTISWSVDYTAGIPRLVVNFNQVREAFGAQGQHTFSCQVDLNTTGTPTAALVGNISIVNPATNPWSNYDTVVGISPGANQSTALPIDLSTVQNNGGVVGGINQAIYEVFKGATSTTPVVGPPFDLTFRTLNFAPINPGTTSASYFYF